MAHSIFRGDYSEQPKSISLPVAGAYTPGSFVLRTANQLTQATAGTGRLLLLTNRDFYSQDELAAYASGETGVAYRIKPDLEFLVQVAAATYTFGQELTVGAAGRLVAAAAGNVVVAFFDDKAKAGVAQTAGSLCDVVIANSYIKA
jgi:hypothetical protein